MAVILYTMAVAIRPQINSKVFSWAVARFGISQEEALDKYPYFLDWANGKILATIKQLKDFSKFYRFPFGYFFLKDIPKESDTKIPFFRSADEYDTVENLNIDETVRILSERQDWLSDYLKNNANMEKNKAVGKFKNETDFSVIVDGMLNFFSLKKGWNVEFHKSHEAVNFLKDKLEEEDIIVVFNSIVNNNGSRPLPVRLCRGFCLIDDYVPFIFVNSADSKSAQLFTLIHELAHIFISFTAGFGEFGKEEIKEPREALCDKVASELLVPKNLLIEKTNTMTNTELSNLFNVSEIVILRRKLDCGLITKSVFFEEYNALPSYKKSGSGGGNFYRTAENRISRKLLNYLDNAMHEQVITPMEAYRLAGLKGDTFTKLVNGMEK